VRVGSQSSAYNTVNTLVKDSIVDGGIFELILATGDHLSLRRDATNPFTGGEHYFILEIKVYECPNLTSYFQSQVTITTDTSSAVTGFEATNLIKNFQNRSSGNEKKAIETAGSHNGIDATRITDETCFKTTHT